MTTNSPWIIWAVLSAVFAACTGILAKVGLKNIDSDFAQFIRTFVVLCGVTLIVSLTGKWQPLSTIDKRAWIFLVLSGIATCLSWTFYYKALQVGEASSVGAVDKLSLVFVAIFATAFLQEDLGARGWTGIFVTVTGILLVFYK